MFELQTDRLQFRQWLPSDYEAIQTFFSDEALARFVGGVKNPESAWRLLATYVGHYELMGFSYPAIVEKATNQLIGTVGLWKSVPWPEHELGYWLLPQAQGKGYGLEAGNAVRDFAQQTGQFPSLVSYIHPDNTPSIKLAKRLGAQFDKTIELLEFGPHQVYRYW